MKIYNIKGNVIYESKTAKTMKECVEEAVRKLENLMFADLSMENLKNSNLQNGFFGGATFKGSNLEGVNFTNSNLVNAYFVKSNLSKANFKNTSFGKTDFSGANLKYVKNLENAYGLEYSIFDKTIVTKKEMKIILNAFKKLFVIKE